MTFPVLANEALYHLCRVADLLDTEFADLTDTEQAGLDSAIYHVRLARIALRRATGLRQHTNGGN